MGRNTPPRKAYRPRAVHANADLVLLDSSRAHIAARYAAAEQAQQISPSTPPAAPSAAQPQQEELFA